MALSERMRKKLKRVMDAILPANELRIVEAEAYCHDPRSILDFVSHRGNEVWVTENGLNIAVVMNTGDSSALKREARIEGAKRKTSSKKSAKWRTKVRPK